MDILILKGVLFEERIFIIDFMICSSAKQLKWKLSPIRLKARVASEISLSLKSSQLRKVETIRCIMVRTSFLKV